MKTKSFTVAASIALLMVSAFATADTLKASNPKGMATVIQPSYVQIGRDLVIQSEGKEALAIPEGPYAVQQVHVNDMVLEQIGRRAQAATSTARFAGKEPNLFASLNNPADSKAVLDYLGLPNHNQLIHVWCDAGGCLGYGVFTECFNYG